MMKIIIFGAQSFDEAHKEVQVIFNFSLFEVGHWLTQ